MPFRIRVCNDMRTKFCSENLKRRDHSENLGVDGRMILESILQK
jgi:hypothetical protein